MATHTITKAKVVRVGPGVYGVAFTFDDGSTETAEVGGKETAAWYAMVQMGEELPVGVNPLLINAATAEKLRKRAAPGMTGGGAVTLIIR